MLIQVIVHNLDDWIDITYPFPRDVKRGEYVMAISHHYLGFEDGPMAYVPIVQEFRVTFTVGDETSEEEVHSWEVKSLLRA